MAATIYPFPHNRVDWSSKQFGKPCEVHDLRDILKREMKLNGMPQVADEFPTLTAEAMATFASALHESDYFHFLRVTAEPA